MQFGKLETDMLIDILDPQCDLMHVSYNLLMAEELRISSRY